MKQAVIIATAFAIQAASSSETRRRKLEAKLRNDKAFLTYASTFNKDISDPDEFTKRQQLYHEQDAVVNAVNARADPDDPDALRFTHNWFSDMTEEEKEKYSGLNEDIDEDEEPVSLPMHSPNRVGRPVPSEVDWSSDRNPLGARKTTAVKWQGRCGSCWAHAVNTTLEATLAIKTNSEPFRLSEQQAVDCTLDWDRGGSYNKRHFRKTDKNINYKERGCNGGNTRLYYKFLIDHGVMRNSDYPYEDK